MIKVKDLEYKRVEINEVLTAFDEFKNAVAEAKSADDFLAAEEVLQDKIDWYATMSSLAYMRYTINTHDEFYVGEQEYYDKFNPEVNAMAAQYSEMLLSSPFRADLEKKLNPLIFKNAEFARKARNEKTVELEKAENALVMEYSKLMSQMLIDWQGKKVPLTIMRGELENDQREVRKAACEAIGRGLEANSEKLDSIYDRLVKNRDAQAKAMGYKNFVELGYYRMGRIDYDRKMVENFRKNVVDNIVPLVYELRQSIAAKLGIDKVMFYDNDVVVKGGNPRPKLDSKGIFAAAQLMYDKMNPETGDFMRRMQEAEAFDVESREGKWGGGYCTHFKKYKQPFILANFNGTAGDIDVITHEFGHALAYDFVYKYGNPDLEVGGMETAETHSMSMEFFCWKFIDLFFDDGDKYRYKHLIDNLSFIPYGCMVDEFQHIIYEQPELTPSERNEVWNKLEAKYRPYLSTEGIPYLEKGTRWQFQMHIYELPFYYIDYCLAQTAALGFLAESRKDYNDAFNRYLAFSKKGGTELFSKLVKEAAIANPFEDGALKAVADASIGIIEELEK